MQPAVAQSPALLQERLLTTAAQINKESVGETARRTNFTVHVRQYSTGTFTERRVHVFEEAVNLVCVGVFVLIFTQRGIY